MLRKSALALGAALRGAFNPVVGSRHSRPLLLSARDDDQGRHYAVGYRLDGRQVFATQVQQRCHAVIRHPQQPIALFVARRPGTESYLLDLRSGALLQTLHTPAGRHFYGHAVIHADGEWLYATENDTTQPGRGVLGRYRFNGAHLTRHSEVPTHGIGPHEVAWMPDGETLVVANGGIRTEAESRVEMNLEAMAPSLVLMDRDGGLVSHDTLAQPMNSIRHLAVGRDGTVLTCQQFMGPSHECAPLLAVKRPRETLQAIKLPPEVAQGLNHYTASVAWHDELRLVGLTAPRANRLLIWDLDSARLRLDTIVPDCAGIAAVNEGFVVTSGQGRCRLYTATRNQISGQPLALPGGFWDNHAHIV